MAVSQVYTIAQVVVDSTPDLVIGGITDQNIDTGLQEMLLAGDGAVDPTFVAVGEVRPVISFTTTQVATVLAEGSDTFALAGLTLDGSNVGKAFCQHVAKGGTRTGASANIMVAINQGILVPRSLRAGADAATLDCDMVATWDGNNTPLAITDGESLIGSASVAAVHVAGPVTINGATYGGVQSISIDFGIQLMVLSGDGAPYPSFVAIQERRPRIRIETTDAGLLYDLGHVGAPQGVTDSVIYFRKVTEGGTRVADATETHISFTIDDGMIWVENVQGSHGGTLTPTVVIQPTFDGSNATLVVDTTAALP